MSELGGCENRKCEYETVVGFRFRADFPSFDGIEWDRCSETALMVDMFGADLIGQNRPHLGKWGDYTLVHRNI